MERSERYAYWERLHRAKKDYLELTCDLTVDIDGAFFKFLIKQYGLQVQLTDGMITREAPVILDSTKYTLFLLKYSA